MAELVYNVTEAAAALGISRRSMYNLIHQEGFPALKLGGRTLISKELLAEWVKAQAGGQKSTALALAHQDGYEGRSFAGHLPSYDTENRGGNQV